MSLVELERVRYRYEDAPTLALDNVSLAIEPDEYVLLAGASGSGKSTLCRLLDGLIPHFHSGELGGRVWVDGLDTREHPVRELFAHVGLVFQNPTAQLFNSTVTREIAFGLESLGLPRGEITRQTGRALEMAHVSHLAERAPNTLSGGEAQLVAIAAMVALRPRILVLDEPFANLDPETVERVRAVLREIHSQGTLIILAEHRLSTSIPDATRLVILDHGQLVRDGTPRMLLREDLSAWRLEAPFVARMARESNWTEIPLTVEEAVTIAQSCDGILPGQFAEPPIPISGDDSVLKVQDVSYLRDKVEVLRHVNLKVLRGDCVAVVGRNGSGKTTLLKHLIGIHRPSLGSVTVLDQDTRHIHVSDLARHVGFVFQNPNDQLFKPNVREEIEVAPRALGRYEAGWVEHLIEWFQLTELLDRSPFTLSEGEKKRVAFASALAAHPAILVLDEPTTGQDYVFRVALERLLLELRNQGMTSVLATHDLQFAEQVASRWCVMAGGEIIGEGSPETIMRDEIVLSLAGLRATPPFRLQRELSWCEERVISGPIICSEG